MVNKEINKIDLKKINRCLISVSDKTNILHFAKSLAEMNVEILSTGGTYKLLKENNVDVIEVSNFTNFPEIMDGRVKTLHPKIHGGLLIVENDETHIKQAKENDISSIDLLVVNLYPFVETLQKTKDEEVIIENIDIGGPAMVRSAAKNFKFKTVVTDIKDYDKIIEELKLNGAISFETRKKLAAKAFENIAFYDMAIANWFNPKSENLLISAKLKDELRYGENPHQKAASYVTSNHGILNATKLQGKELSYNNINDAEAAYNIALEFNIPTAVIVKHANPCGVAFADNLLDAYKRAFSSDKKSAFGGIVALNGQIDEELAKEITKTFFEVIIAKDVTESAKRIFSDKKNLRVITSDFVKDFDEKQIKSISGGFLVQDYDNKILKIDDIEQVGECSIQEEEKESLLFAMKVCKNVKSNAIVVTNQYQTIGIGIGQTNRVDACEIACKKSQEFNENDTEEKYDKNLYLASDAFFPFADNIVTAAKYNIKAIIAPKGSIRDSEVIEEANKQKIALYFIDSRHFRH